MVCAAGIDSILGCGLVCVYYTSLFPSELRLDGNHLQSSGALALLRPIAEYAEKQGKDQPTLALLHAGNPLQPSEGKPLPDLEAPLGS